MDRIDESDVTELGVATVETRGREGMIPDWAQGQEPGRLTDD